MTNEQTTLDLKNAAQLRAELIQYMAINDCEIYPGEIARINQLVSQYPITYRTNEIESNFRRLLINYVKTLLHETLGNANTHAQSIRWEYLKKHFWADKLKLFKIHVTNEKYADGAIRNRRRGKGKQLLEVSIRYRPSDYSWFQWEITKNGQFWTAEGVSDVNIESLKLRIADLWNEYVMLILEHKDENPSVSFVDCAENKMNPVYKCVQSNIIEWARQMDESVKMKRWDE